MKKNGKKWRKIQREKEERRASLTNPVVAKEPQEFVCTHCDGIPFLRYPKLPPDIYIATPCEICRPHFIDDWYDGSLLCSLIRKSSTYQCHCKKCKTEFHIEDMERMEKLVQYLKQPDWEGQKADLLAIGIEPVRCIKDGKKIIPIEKKYEYYRKYYKENPPDNSVKGTVKEITALLKKCYAEVHTVAAQSTPEDALEC